MKKIVAEERKMLVWEERKVISKVFYTPDTFLPSVLKTVSEEEAKSLEAQWEAEARAEAEVDRESQEA